MKFKYTFLQLIAVGIMFGFCNGNLFGQIQNLVLCPGDSIEIVLDSSTTNTSWIESTDLINWSPVTTSDPASITVAPTSATYYLAETDVNGCTYPSDTILVTLSTLALDLNETGPVNACAGSEYTIMPTITGDDTVLWTSPTFTFADPSLANQTIGGVDSTQVGDTQVQVFLTVSDVDGCSLTDSLTINFQQIADSGMMVFDFASGAETSVVFPTCIDTLNFELWGADGNAGEGSVNQGMGGLGGFSGGQLLRDVVIGDSVWLFLGGIDGTNGGGAKGTTSATPPGFEGGGGGGATDVRYGGKTPNDRVAVAGGGGGGGGGPQGPAGVSVGGNGGDAGWTTVVGTMEVGADGGDANWPGFTPPTGGSGGGNANIAQGLGGSSGSCADGLDGELPSGVATPGENGGKGGDSDSVPTSCTEGAAGGGGGGGLGAAGGGSAMSFTSGASFSAAGGGGGGSMSGGLINTGTVLGLETNPAPLGNGYIRVTWNGRQ